MLPEVAEMVEKAHNELMKDIRRYIGNLNEGKISHVEFFENSTFQDERSNN